MHENLNKQKVLDRPYKSSSNDVHRVARPYFPKGYFFGSDTELSRDGAPQQLKYRTDDDLDHLLRENIMIRTKHGY